MFLPPAPIAANVPAPAKASYLPTLLLQLLHHRCHHHCAVPLLMLSPWLSPLLPPVTSTIAKDETFVVAAMFAITKAAFIPP
jgi:hypothetical protein